MTESTDETLPVPVTANGDAPCRKGRVEWSTAPPLMAYATGLIAISSRQPRAALYFIAAGTVTIGIYFVVPPKDDVKTNPIMSTFLRRLPDIFTTVGCGLIVLGIGTAFPNEVALIPLFLFISFVALAALFGMTLGVWTTASLYCAALVSLITFVVFAFMA